MDIVKEFNNWFDSSQLARIALTPGEKAMIQLAFEKGADIMLESLRKNKKDGL